MRGFFVPRRRASVAICLDEHKARWVVLLLDDIEPSYAGFADAVARIFERGLFESLDALRFDAHMNMDNEHRFFSGRLPRAFIVRRLGSAPTTAVHKFSSPLPFSLR